MEPRLDANWHYGVPGWMVDGRHVRLRDVLTLVAPEDRDGIIRRHEDCIGLLSLVLMKLRAELQEVQDPFI